MHLPQVLPVGTRRRRRRTFLAPFERGAVQDVLVIGHVVGACRAAFAVRDHGRTITGVSCGLLDIDPEDLVALQAPCLVVALHAELRAVGREVGLCIVAAERQLTNVLQVGFLSRCCGEHGDQGEGKCCVFHDANYEASYFCCPWQTHTPQSAALICCATRV